MTKQAAEIFPRTGVSIAVRQNGHVLLVKRGKPPFENHWAFPGGAQELGERLEEAAHRELTEETGLIARHLSFIGFVDRVARNEAGAITHHYVLARFLCDHFDGSPVAQDDALAILWANAGKVAELPTVPDLAALVSETLALPIN